MKTLGIRNQWIAAFAIVAVLGVTAMNLGTRAGAQETTTASPAATVSVNGSGLVMVAPDAASISIGVNVIQGSLSEAQAQATTEMTAVIDALKAAGIEDKDIQTSNYSVNILQDYDTNGYPAKITGFQVNNQVNVTVRDLTKLGEILDSAVTAGANSIYGITFLVTDPSGATSQARTAAVDNATQKAQELAAATGATLGRVVSVTESFGWSPAPMNYDSDMAMAEKAAVPIEGGTSTITVDVQITFELVQ